MCAVWQNRPSLRLWKNLINILLYLRATPHLGLVFTRPNISENLLIAYCDAALAREEHSHSRWGYYFFFCGGLVSWYTKYTSRKVSSSTEAEVHALVNTGKENIWMREFISELAIFKNIGPTEVYNDNESALRLSTGGTCHKRSKHFGIEFDVFKEYIQLKEISLLYLHTDLLPADMLTKPLSAEKFIKFRDVVMGGERLQMHFHGNA
jgi:hypothetical protein